MKVSTAQYPEGEKIPSVRELASEVGVNPNTIMHAYGELQLLNIIDNKRGIGYFVCKGARKVIAERKRKEFFKKTLPEFIRQAELLEISLPELKKHLDQLK